MYIPSLGLPLKNSHSFSVSLKQHTCIPSLCSGPQNPASGKQTFWNFSRDMAPLSECPVARVLVNNERHVWTWEHRKIFDFVLFVSGKPGRLALFQPLDLSFYEDNDNHRVIILATPQALRGSQPDALMFLCLSL